MLCDFNCSRVVLQPSSFQEEVRIHLYLFYRLKHHGLYLPNNCELPLTPCLVISQEAFILRSFPALILAQNLARFILSVRSVDILADQLISSLKIVSEPEHFKSSDRNSSQSFFITKKSASNLFADRACNTTM